MRRTVLFSSATIAFLAVFLAAQTPAPVSEWRYYGADAGSTAGDDRHLAREPTHRRGT